jgi:hypothetical protein
MMATDATRTERTKPEPARGARGRDPVPEQQPWRTPEDAEGWRRVYHGKGQPHTVTNVVELELTAEQWTWLNRASNAQGVMLHELLGKLVDDARAADERREARAKKLAE